VECGRPGGAGPAVRAHPRHQALRAPRTVGGAALLFALGRRGVIGAPLYEATGLVLPFSLTGVIIANTFHLHLQPGEDVIREMGGLHRFMGWNGPLMTDSGGFQVFSLGAGKEQGVGKVASHYTKNKNRSVHYGSQEKESLVKVDENGIEFTSYLDGSRHRFTPEGVIEIERKLGADIILVLDECTSPLHDYQYTKAAMKRTHRWAIRALEKFQRISDKSQGHDVWVSTTSASRRSGSSQQIHSYDTV